MKDLLPKAAHEIAIPVADYGLWKTMQSNTFSWKNGSLWYKDHLYICNNSQIKQKILLELHTSPLGGHSGFLKTYHRVKKDFFLDGLKSDIQKFVAECLVSQ